ncbi:uncharacterized protein JCM15063_002571 [Sporobolomyces koalae]|uniref:uncharacterized protein n=1 Tax=Sporobolomyces koalae TaxID=500713 RepID=UPI0031775F8D
MKLLALLSLTCLAASASALPAGPSLSLEKRQGHCHDGMTSIIAYDNKLLCIGSRTVWTGAAITSIGQGTVQTIASRVSDWIASTVWGQIDTSQGRRLARRELKQGDGLIYLEVGGAQAGVPFIHDADGKTTINVLDFIARSGSSLAVRDAAGAEATVTGGTATFYSNGTLDNFTLDFGVPAAAYESTSNTTALAKRSYWSLHTTYWANQNNAHTSLNWNQIHALVLESYGSLPKGVSQACGYMANSGTWHGAFRHWTGDSGYQIGECQAERKY